ncbi:MAG: DPP IV N-terminal domain-containing protein [bacterium]
MKFQQADSRIFNEAPVRLTRSPSPKNDPAWSPDGAKIAYSVTIRSTEIFTFPLTADARVQLGYVRGTIVASQFDISPDGTQLVFASNDTGQLVVANIQNSMTSILTPEHTGASGPAWSPDGTLIAFSAPDNASSLSLWTVPGGGGRVTKITAEPGSEVNPSWSPDGARIVFELRRDTLCTLQIVDLATGEVTPLTPDSVCNHDPAWSPDGTTIAYVSTRNDTTSIWTLTLTDSQETRVTKVIPLANRPAWSPDGTRIAYRTPEGIWISSPKGVLLSSTTIKEPFPVWLPGQNTLLEIATVENAFIEVISLDDSTKTPVTRLSEAYSDFTPAWFPDSETLVFAREFSDTTAVRRTLWVTTYPDGVAAPLFGPPDRNGFENNPAVSPDGTLLVFDDGFSIFLNVVGSQTVLDLMPFIGGNLRQAAWSPQGDGFICNNGSKMRIFRTDSSLVVSQQVINRSFRNPAWSSPHPVFGENIAGESSSGIHLMSVDGTSTRLIIPGGRDASWAPDGANLAYVREDQVYVLKILLRLLE